MVVTSVELLVPVKVLCSLPSPQSISTEPFTPRPSIGVNEFECVKLQNILDLPSEGTGVSPLILSISLTNSVGNCMLALLPVFALIASAIAVREESCTILADINSSPPRHSPAHQARPAQYPPDPALSSSLFLLRVCGRRFHPSHRSRCFCCLLSRS